MPTSSPRAVRKGDLAPCASKKNAVVLLYSAPGSLLCFVPLLYPYARAESVGGGSISLMKITFTPAPLLPIQPTLCNR